MIWLAVFQRNWLFVSTGGFLKMEIVCFFRIISLLQKKWFSCNWNNQSRKMSHIIKFGLLLLCVLWFKVRYRSVTHQCHAELCVDHKIVPAWSQFCRKAIFFFIWVFHTAFFFVLWGGKLGKVVEIYEGCFSRCKCSCCMQRVTACLCWCRAGIENYRTCHWSLQQHIAWYH